MAASRASAPVRAQAKRRQGYVQAGLLSREMGLVRGCRRCHDKRKAISSAALARAVVGPCAVGEPVHVRNLIAREPGGPAFARPADQRAGRSGNAEAVRLR